MRGDHDCRSRVSIVYPCRGHSLCAEKHSATGHRLKEFIAAGKGGAHQPALFNSACIRDTMVFKKRKLSRFKSYFFDQADNFINFIFKIGYDAYAGDIRYIAERFIKMLCSVQLMVQAFPCFYAGAN